MDKIRNLVTIIVPCYNQGQYLSDALTSVFDQTFQKWECIIVNDGSTDNTEEVTLEWIKKDDRFKYIKTPNGGPSVSRNVALKIASGDYIQFLDGDDVIDSKKIEIQIDALESTSNYALSICDYLKSTEDDLSKPLPSLYLTPKFKTTDYLNELIIDWETKLSIPIHCFLFKRNLFLDNNIFFNETLPNHVDWECWMNIFTLKPEVKYIDLKLATYRYQIKGRVTSNKKLMKMGFLQAIELQKRKFNRYSFEYKLLQKKYNLIRYEIYSINYFKKYCISVFKKVVRKIYRAVNYLNIRIKS